MPVQYSAKRNTEIDTARFGSRSFLLIASNILKLSVQLVILYIYSRMLSLEAYGLYQAIWLYVNVISVISMFGLPAILLSSSYADIKLWIASHRTRFISFAALVNLLPCIYLIFSPIAFDLSTRLLLIILTFSQSLSLISETISVKNQKESRVLMINILFSMAFLGWHIYMANDVFNIDALITGLIILNLLKSFFVFTKPVISTLTSRSDVGKQWLFLGMFDIAGMLFRWLDKWFILYFVSVSHFAIYFNGAYEIPVFGLMLSAVGNIMLVELSRKNRSDINEIRSLFFRSSRLLASIVFPAFAFLLFYHEAFFTLIFSEKYLASIPVFLVAIFVLPVRITSFTFALQVNNRNDIVFKGAIIDLIIAIVLMMILYPAFGVRGLAASFVISTYFQAGYYLYQTSLLTKTPALKLLPFADLFWMILLSLSSMAIIAYFDDLITTTHQLVAGVIACGIIILLLLSFYKRKIKGYTI